MPEEKIIAGSGTGNQPEMVIAGEGEKMATTAPGKETTTLAERLSASTAAGGLKQLPDNYDAPDGDWCLIRSNNPFEVLYLDYQLYKLINPQIVTANYTLLEKFWQDKILVMNTGGNRIAFKNKYGEGTVENSLIKLKKSFEKLKTAEGIEQYYFEITAERIKKGEAGLEESIEHMILDGCADKAEIKLCIDRGFKYDLTAEESAIIIKKSLDAAQFKPYGKVTGHSLLDQLFSVDNWMTQAKIDEAEQLKKERDSLKIQILPNRYATTITEIGSILFEDPVEAKEIIREDLLKQVIAQKDIVLGRTIGSLSKDPNTDAAFLSIVYKLNPSLPFAFTSQKMARTVEELCNLFFENEQTLKLGKEQLKKGFIEIWLRETDTPAYNRFLLIRDNAENIDLAFIEFLYTFKPSLPYRFAGNMFVKTPEELCIAIDRKKETWEAGRKELFNSWIITWLSAMQHHTLVKEWNNVKDKYVNQQDIGHEYFLHLLKSNLDRAKLVAGIASVNYPKIQSGRLVKTDISVTNETRGCVSSLLGFSKTLPGVTLSAENMVFNNVAGNSLNTVTLFIDTALLVKGVPHETSILIRTSEQQEIEIPVFFKIVFPKNAFWLEVTKFALLISAFFVLSRLVVSSENPGWLNNRFVYYIRWQQMMDNLSNYSSFGWAFCLLIAFFSTLIYFLIKPRIKK